MTDGQCERTFNFIIISADREKKKQIKNSRASARKKKKSICIFIIIVIVDAERAQRCWCGLKSHSAIVSHMRETIIRTLKI